MANEYQPLDINQNPMGVLQPGKTYAVEDLSSIILPESGVYRFCIYSNGPESAFKFSASGNASYMFQNCPYLLEVNGLDFHNSTACFQMFYKCDKLNRVSNLDLRNTTNAVQMFENCQNLLSVTGCNFNSLVTCWEMFYGCSKLQTISDINFTNIKTASNMFYGCTSLSNFHNLTPISCSLSFADSPLLDSSDAESYVLGQLADLTGETAQTITFNTALQGIISESAIQAATDKNWVVTFADNM